MCARTGVQGGVSIVFQSFYFFISSVDLFATIAVMMLAVVVTPVDVETTKTCRCYQFVERAMLYARHRSQQVTAYKHVAE